MNRIYKVIWSKTKHCYTVVSELATSRTKSPSTGIAGTKSLAAALAVLAITGGLVFGMPGTVNAADIPTGTATQGQYIAFQAYKGGEHSNWENQSIGDTKSFNNHEYVLTEVTKPNSTEKIQFWVRKGYSIELEPGKYNSSVLDKSAFKIVAHKGTDADETGLLTFSDVSQVATGTKTVLGDALTYTEAGLYGGAVNSPGVDTVNDNGDNYLFNPSGDNKTFRKANQANDFTSEGLTYDGKNFKYNNQTISSENVYILNGTPSVFLDSNKQVYTGRVFGNNNEYLVTAYDKTTGKYYSFWAAQYNDPNETMNVTYGDWADLNNAYKNADDMLAKADIKYISLQEADADKDGNKNGGTFGLARNTSGNKAVDGAITVTSIGGTGGNDVQVRFTNKTPTAWDENGNVTATEDRSFTVNAGSKVEANKDGVTTGDNLTHLTVNGVNYTVPQGETYTGTGAVNISNDNQISVATGNGIDTTGDQLAVKAGNGVTVDTNGVSVNYGKGLKLDTEDSDKLSANLGTGLKFDENNAIAADVNNINLSYGVGDAAKKQVSLATGLTFKQAGSVTVTDKGDGTIEISGTDTDTYVTSGKVVTKEDGKQYLQLSNNGTNTIEDIELSSLKDVYTGTGAVKVNGNEISIATGNGIDTTGDQLAVKAGNGVTVDTNGVSVKAAPNGNLSVDSNGVKLNNTVDLTASGSVQTGNVKVSNSGITMGNQKVTGLAKGTNASDAVRYDQLTEVSGKIKNYTAGDGIKIGTDNKISVKAGDGLGIATDGSVNVNVGKGLSIASDTINVKTGKNITTDTSGNIALKDDVTGLTSVESDVFKVDNATYISSSGLNANNKVISNVATGVKGTDAVNVNQLNAAKTTLTIGDATDPNDGSKNFVITDEGKNGNHAYKLNLSNEIRIGKSEQKKADGTVTVAGQNAKFTMINSDGKYVDLQIDGSDKAIKTVDGKNVVRVKAVNNAGVNTLAVMSDGLKFTGDNYKQDDAKTVVTKKLNETLSIKGGKADNALLTKNNIGVVAENGVLNVKLAKDVDLGTNGSLKIGSLKAATDSLTIGGMKATSKLISLDNNMFAAGYQADDTDKTGKKSGYYVDGLSNTAWDGKTIDANRAATEGQLKKAVDSINTSITATNNTPLYFKANSTPDTSKGLARKLGETITIKGTGTRDSGEYSGQNIRTSFDNSGNLMIMMDKDLKERSLTLGELRTDADGKVTSIAQPGKLTIYGWSSAEKVDIKAGNQQKDYIDGDGKKQVTRITYADSTGTSHTFATMDDGLKFSGDTSDAADDVKSKLNTTVKITGGASMKSHKDDKGNVVYDELTDKNIGVVSDGKQLVVKLAEDVNLGSEGTLTLGANTTADGKTTKNRIYLNGNKGDITVGDISIYGGSPTSDKDTEAGTIRGLSNTAWTSDIAKWSKDKNTISARQAATQGQLSDVEQKIAVVYGNKNLGNDKSAKYSLRSTDSKAGAFWQQIENNPNNDGKPLYATWDNLGGKITTGISLGYNATVDNMQGNKAYSILFGNHDQGYTSGIAIGENSYALTDSVNVGIRNYKHEMGDVSLADDWKAYDNAKYNRTDNIGVGSTTLGSNSYSGGALATTVGTYNIMTNRYQYNETPYAAQNAGAISIGALNSIESYQTGDGSAADRYSGIGNSVVGLANKTNNSNGSLIFGAGNEITNSIGSIADPTGSWKGSVADAANSFRKGAVENAGGAVMAIGGGNKADYALYSQIMGVGNTLKGTQGNEAAFNLLDGYNNTVVNSQHTNVIGSGNTVTDSSSMTVIGDNHNVKGEHTIIIGSADKASEEAQYAKDAVMIGHNAEAGNTSVAIGVNANAAYGQNTAVGPYASVQEGVGNSTALGYGSQVGTRDIIPEDGNDGIISVGRSTGQSGEAGFTRRIINVKAGVNDTDAVNVSQLKKVAEDAAANHTILSNGKNTTVEDIGTDGKHNYKVNLNDNITLGEGATQVQINGKPSSAGVPSITVGEKNANGNYNFAVGQNGSISSNVVNSLVDNKFTFDENGITVSTNVNGKNKGDTVINGDTIVTTNENGGSTTIDGDKISTGTIVISGDNNSIHGLSNTTWNGTTDDVSRAATEGQLKDLNDTWAKEDKGNVKYDKNEDGSINYDSVTFAGTTYTGLGTDGVYHGGTHVYNVAYASGQRGDEAVNVDYLNDKVTEIEMNTAASEKHIDTSKEYTVDSNGQVKLDEVNGNDKPTGNQIIINDVANKAQQDKNTAAIGKINDTIGASGEDGLKDDYKDTNYLKDSNTLVDADKALDAAIKQNSDRITNVEETAKKHTTVTNTDKNITIQEGTNDKGGINYELGLNNDKVHLGEEGNGGIDLEGNNGKITVTNSYNVGSTVVDGNGISVGGDGGSALTKDSLTVGGHAYITDKGMDANNQKITNVADGEVSADSKDAVNGSQLYGVQQQVNNNSLAINNVARGLYDLDDRVDKVGAGAAALAALHPLDFDPDAKWDFAAGYGNYRSASAAAIGAYYRPNEDTMFSVGGTFGNGENMVNAGVSFKLGSGSSHVTTSRVAMAKELKDMREIVAKQDAQIAKLTAMVNALVGVKEAAPDTASSMFPDVPENHWAYAAVEQMAKSGLVEGYPDGSFHGDRTMTRYEFAQIIYNAIQKGAEVDARLVSEFQPELEYFRVDTIARDKDGNPTIERVRVNK